MKIHYVSGSRADFGLIETTLQAITAENDMAVGVIATGQHTSQGYGDTLSDILASGLPIHHTIEVNLTGTDGAEMAHANARQLSALVDYWKKDRPDLVFVLGDRGEMLMAALAAAYLGIHVAHFHGGERSGTIDESLRHAISKISHFHFTATDDARHRLIEMGEHPDYVWTVGAPGLVGLTDGTNKEPDWLHATFNVPRAPMTLLLAFHPVVQEADNSGKQMTNILDALDRMDCSGIILRPNSDAGGRAIDSALDRFKDVKRFRILDHLPRQDYCNVLANIDLLIGNTSSGIVESASFGVPFLNLGTRQQGRLRNTNVVDCGSIEAEAIIAAVDTARSLKGPFENLFGDGKTPERLLPVLRKLVLDGTALSKLNTY